MKFKSIIILLAFTFSLALYAEKNKGDYINDLRSSDTGVVTKKEACSWLVKNEINDGLSYILTTIKKDKNAGVRIHCMAKLSDSEKKGDPTTAMRYVVEEEKDKDLVYTALASILNLKDYENLDAKLAFEFAEKNHMDDAFIKNMIDKLKNTEGYKKFMAAQSKK